MAKQSQDARNEDEVKKGIGADIFSSIVVFLVALPLCMGVAIASGAPVASGLITGIIGGIVVGYLGGCPLQVSGPAAGLTVIIYEAVREHGLAVLGLAVLVAGLMQLGAGLLRLGQWFRAVSPAVIEGMLAGIGVLILASQIHVMVDDKPRKNGLENLRTIPEAIQKGLPWPDFGSVEDRRLRLEYLQAFGDLHELHFEYQQYLIAHEADLAAGGNADTPSRYLVLAREHQAELVAILQDLSQRVDHSILVARGEVAGEELHNQIAEALESAKRVQAELLGDPSSMLATRVDRARIEDDMEATEEAIAAVLGKLKNHDLAAKLGLLTIAIIILWQFLIAKRLPLIPAPLVAVVVATALTAYFYLPVLFVELPERLIDGIRLPTMNAFQSTTIWNLLQLGFMIGLIASAETLLCCTAVDLMHRGPRTNYDKELTAQGIGNTLCGLVGALPMTGVIVRSAANIQAGARTRWSAIFHGLWILLFVVIFSQYLEMIPTASLAAILVYTGFRLIDFLAIRNLWSYGKSEVAIFFATVIVIVVEDLLTGVLVGLALSALKLLINLSKLNARLQINDKEKRAVLILSGAATFVRLPQLASYLERIPAGYEAQIQIEELQFIDHACLELLLTWSKNHLNAGGSSILDWENLFLRSTKSGGKPDSHEMAEPNAPKKDAIEDLIPDRSNNTNDSNSPSP